MSHRTFNDLIAIFPNLGPEGARAEATACRLPQDLAATLADAHNSYGSDLHEALRYWTENNEKILPFMIEENGLGEAQAFADLLAAQCVRYRQWEAPKTADQYALEMSDRIKNHSAQLRGAKHSLDCTHIYRGEAIDSALVGTEYDLGKRQIWQVPRAFTLEPEFTPLHFVWKQWERRTAEGLYPAGIILEVQLHEDRETRLLWAGDTPPSSAQKADMRWQKEVLTAPGFEIEVVSCDPIFGAPVPIYRVMAIELRS